MSLNMRLHKKDIIGVCEETENIKFKEGKFEGGCKYMIELTGFGRHLVWNCRTLKDCAEALVQANFLVDTVF
jgi:hypothetical protein